ncbi:3999_t:CDS:2, partial [Scutellospora calospora]
IPNFHHEELFEDNSENSDSDISKSLTNLASDSLLLASLLDPCLKILSN